MTTETDGQQPAPDAVAPVAEAPAQVETEHQVEATATETDDHGADDTAQPDDGRKPAKGVQKRLDELTRQRHEAAREAEYWRQQAQSLVELLPAQQAATPAQDTMDDAPTEADFDYDQAAYKRALNEYIEKRAASVIDRRLTAREQEAQQRAQAQAFDAKITEARTKYADFDEVVFAPNVPISGHMADALKQLPDGPDVAYALGKNPSEAARIASLPPVLQAVEIGRLSARAAAAPQPKPNPPAPPLTLGGVNSGPVSKSPAEMSMAEYVKWRAAST